MPRQGCEPQSSVYLLMTVLISSLRTLWSEPNLAAQAPGGRRRGGGGVEMKRSASDFVGHFRLGHEN